MTFLTRDEARAIDRRAVEEFHMPGILLMENAARGAAELFMHLQPRPCKVAIHCGPGNNGGDGYCIARHLHNAGYAVTLVGFGTDKLTPDCQVNFDIVRAMQLPMATDFPVADWHIDALFGTGLTRGLGSPYAEWIEKLNASDKPILAIDLPSGLDCDTGEPLGPCVKAAHTATFVGLKKGFQNPGSRAWTGRTHVVGIGCPKDLAEPSARLQ